MNKTHPIRRISRVLAAGAILVFGAHTTAPGLSAADTFLSALLEAQKNGQVAVLVQFNYAEKEKYRICSTQIKKESIRRFLSDGMAPGDVDGYETKPFSGATAVTSEAQLPPDARMLSASASDANLKQLYDDLMRRQTKVFIMLNSQGRICAREGQTTWGDVAEMQFESQTRIYLLRERKYELAKTLSATYKAEIQRRQESVRSAARGHTMQIKLGIGK